MLKIVLRANTGDRFDYKSTNLTKEEIEKSRKIYEKKEQENVYSIKIY